MSGPMRSIMFVLMSALLKTNIAATVKVALLAKPSRLCSAVITPVTTSITMIPIATTSTATHSVMNRSMACPMTERVMIVSGSTA